MLAVLYLLMSIPGVILRTPCTSHFCPPDPEKRDLTLDRELAMKIIGRDLETGCLCTELPNTYSLCYNSEDKTVPCLKFPKKIKIPTDALIIKSTYITEVSYGDFNSLSHLKVLILDGNQKLLYIQPFVFENMKNLITLSFIFNPSLSTLHPDTFRGLDNLEELNLVKNGFRRVDVLSVSSAPNILPKLRKLNLNENIFKNISRDDFKAMKDSPLEELYLVLCGIEYIDSEAMIPLRNLSVLNLGANRFDPGILTDLLNETIRSGIDLRSLNLYSSGFRGIIHRKLLEIIGESNINSLTLTRNQFDIIDNETFPVKMLNLNVLELADVTAQTISEQAFANLPNLKTLLLGKNKLSYFAASRYLPKLTYLDLRENTDAYGWEFFLTKSQFHKMKLEYLNLEYTRLLLLSKTDFKYMTHLRVLNLKNCSILKIEDNTFKDLVSLRILNLENNRFFKLWLKERFNMFGGLEHLETLLMGGNDITTITTLSNYLLKHLKKLKYLGLKKNSLQNISPGDFAPLTELEKLDISENYIVSWDARVFMNNNLKEFHGSVNKLAYLSEAMLQDFQNLTSIGIDYNSFICDCRIKKVSHDKKALSRFLNLLKEEIFCLSPSNITLSSFLLSIINSTLDCGNKLNPLVVLIPSVITLVIIIALSILGYIYRWHIRYWAFLVRLYLTRKGRIQNTRRKGYTNYQYDAFVSYCNQDRNFVVRLVRMLENHEPYLKLCVYERDFQVGSVISESVLDHITKSRKTLLIVSNAYAKSYWCNWETQIAEHHRLFFENPNGDYIDESIVLIKLGPIIDSHLNPTLKYLLKTRIYLEWDSSDNKQKVFWSRLRQFLTPPPQNGVSESTHL